MTVGDGGWGRRVDVVCRVVVALLVFLPLELADIGGTAGAQSLAVTAEAADGAPFTDDPLVAGVTPVRAVHFEELRRRIDALRGRAALPAFAWTDAVLTPGVTPVRWVHVTELRVALDAAYVVTRRPSPAWEDAVVTAGATPIRAGHVNELRAAVVALETAPNRAPTAVGVVPARTLTVGGGALAIDVAPYFDDPDRDSLTYEATSSDTGIVTAGVSGSTVTLAPVAGGAATVTVTARDGEGLSASQAVSVTVRRPDLVVESPGASDATVETGASFTLSMTVFNRGGGAATSTTLLYLRSSDSTISASDTQVGAVPVSGLAAGSSELVSVTLTAPDSAGTYYYGGCVEAVGGESETGNNCSSGVLVTVESPPPPPPPPPRPPPDAVEVTFDECSFTPGEQEGEMAVTVRLTFHARRDLAHISFVLFFIDGSYWNQPKAYLTPPGQRWVGELSAGQTHSHTAQGHVKSTSSTVQCAVLYSYSVR